MTRRARTKTSSSRRGSPGRSSWRGVALALFVLGLGAAALGVRYLRTAHRGRGAIVRVSVPEGVSAPALAGLVARAGALDHAWAFVPLVWATGTHRRIPAGTVVLRDNLTPRALLVALRRGGVTVRVTVPEGFTRFDIARRLEAASVCSAEAFLVSTESPAALERYGVSAMGPAPSLEGRLAPSTYDLHLDARADAVVERMVRLFTLRFDALKAAHPEGVQRAAALAGTGADADQVIVSLASIIERETGAAEDRAHVASVFWNRLTRPDFRPRLLQSDPTVVYGCVASARGGLLRPLAPCGAPEAGARMTITAAMLADARNAWNTYRHEGLAPTPVCNPGAEALRAALEPARTDDLYFVARGDGRSVFAATLEAHHRNVREHLRRGAPPPPTATPRDVP